MAAPLRLELEEKLLEPLIWIGENRFKRRCASHPSANKESLSFCPAAREGKQNFRQQTTGCCIIYFTFEKPRTPFSFEMIGWRLEAQDLFKNMATKMKSIDGATKPLNLQKKSQVKDDPKESKTVVSEQKPKFESNKNDKTMAGESLERVRRRSILQLQRLQEASSNSEQHLFQH